MEDIKLTIDFLERRIDGIADRRLRHMLNALVVTMRNIIIMHENKRGK